MREMTKDKFTEEVTNRLRAHHLQYKDLPVHVVRSQVDAVLSAARQTLYDAVSGRNMERFDKIRINDILHVRVKYAAGGKYKDFQSGEIMARPARYVAQLCTTFTLNDALKTCMATHLHDLTVPPEHLAPAPTASEE